jgi:hypothetical protein
MFSYFKNPSHNYDFMWVAKVSQIDEMMRLLSCKHSETKFLNKKAPNKGLSVK